MTPLFRTGKYGQEEYDLDGTPPCPASGYRLGRAWLVEPLPARVIMRMRQLGALLAPRVARRAPEPVRPVAPALRNARFEELPAFLKTR